MLLWLLQELKRTKVPGKLLWSYAGQPQAVQTQRFMLRAVSGCRNAHKVEFDPHVKGWEHSNLSDESSIVGSTTETFKCQPAPAPKYINLGCIDMLK